MRYSNIKDLDVAKVMRVSTQGIKPVPRRDHAAILLKSNSYLLIYGGKND